MVIPASFVKFELYNNFSTNSDGFNDRFVVKSNGRDLQYSLMIFNRCGATVYRTGQSVNSFLQIPIESLNHPSFVNLNFKYYMMCLMHIKI